MTAIIDASRVCFRVQDISLRFDMQESQWQVVSKLKFEFRTEWGAVGNFGFDWK